MYIRQRKLMYILSNKRRTLPIRLWLRHTPWRQKTSLWAVLSDESDVRTSHYHRQLRLGWFLYWNTWCKTDRDRQPPSTPTTYFLNINKPGTAQVGAISKAQKVSKTKTTFSTTGDNKSSQKTKNWEKNSNFFWSFRIVPKNVKGGTLWDVLNIHSVCKISKIDGRNNKKNRKKISLTVPKKGGKSQCRKKWTLLLWNGFLSHVRGFGCVENEVLSTYGKSW